MNQTPELKSKKTMKTEDQVCGSEGCKACRPWPTKCRILMGSLLVLLLAAATGTGWSLFQHRLIAQRLATLESHTHSLSQQGEQGKAHLSQLAQSHEEMAQSTENLAQALTILHTQESKLQDMETSLHQLNEHLQALHEHAQEHAQEHALENSKPALTVPNNETTSAAPHGLSHFHHNELKHLINQLSSSEAFEIDEEIAHLLPHDVLDQVTHGATHPLLPFPQLLKMFKACLPEALSHQENTSDNMWSKLAHKVMVIRKTGDRATPGSLDNILAQMEKHLTQQNAHDALEALHDLPETMHPAFTDLIQALETHVSRHEALEALEQLENAQQEAS